MNGFKPIIELYGEDDMSFNELRLTIPQQQLEASHESLDVYKDVLLNQLMESDAFVAQLDKVVINIHNLNRIELNGDTRYTMVLPIIQKYMNLLDSLRGLGPKLAGALVNQKLLNQLNVEISYACKLLMRDCVPHSLEEKSQFVLWTLTTLAEQIKDHYEKYQMEPRGLWGEANRLYEFSVHHRLNLFEPPPQYRSIENCYKEICLISAANPYRLTARESRSFYSWIRSWAAHCELNHQESPEFNQHYYYIDLESGSGPVISRKLKNVANDPSILTLNPLPLIEKAKSHLVELKKGQPPAQVGFRNGTDPIDAYTTLKKVVQTYSHATSRRAQRVKEAHQVMLAVGLHSIHGIMKRINKSDNIVLKGNTVNISKTGSCINVSQPKNQQPIQVGDVLAQRDSSQPKQKLAIIRWLKASGQSLLIGVEFIVGRAQPVALKIKNNLAEALLISSANSDTLITDVGLHRNGEPIAMKLLNSNIPVHAISGPLVGRFGGTDQFRIVRRIKS